MQRQVDTDVADTIKQQLSDAKLKGVYYLDDTKRVYPYGDVASQVLGVVGSDGDGLTGLEYYYNDVLSGTDGQMIVETGLTGTPIAGGTSQITEAKNGEGATPIKTEKGWLHIAHGVRNTAAGLRYVLYAFAASLEDPSKVIAEPGGMLLGPLGRERAGDVSNVVFTNGAIADEDGRVFLYYASSDT